MASIETYQFLKEPLAYGTDYILDTMPHATNTEQNCLTRYITILYSYPHAIRPGDESANPNEAILIDSEALPQCQNG